MGRISRRWRVILAYAGVAVVIAAIPLATSVYLAHRNALSAAEDHVDAIAAEVALRASDVLLAAETILADIRYEARQSCSPELVREMRKSVAIYSEIRSLEVLAGSDRLVCTSLGVLEPPLRIRRTDPAITPTGSLIRFTPPAAGAYIPGVSIAAVLEVAPDRWVQAVFPPVVLVSRARPSDLGPQGRVEVRMAGVLLASVGPEPTAGVDLLRATAPAGVYDTEVTVVVPRAWALRDWMRSALINGLLGLIAAAGLVTATVSMGRRRLSLAGELREAIARREFAVEYQPVIDLRTGGCVGAEALLRWNHPERGRVRPDEFIPLAEETGLIIPITRQLMETILNELGGLLKARPDLHVAINLAPAHLSDAQTVADLREAFAGGPPLTQIHLEATERGLIDDNECAETVRHLRALGCRIGVDDFGIGYSSLGYLHKFELDFIKVDKLFVSAIGSEQPMASLTDIVIDMAKALDLKVVAEGVETQEQADHLRARGAEYAQGWLFARPMPADRFVAFVERDEARPAVA